MVSRLNIFGLDGVPLVKRGDDLVGIIIDALMVSNERLQDDDSRNSTKNYLQSGRKDRIA